MLCKNVFANYRPSLHGLRYIYSSHIFKNENNNSEIMQSKRMRKMLSKQKNLRIGAHVIKAPVIKEASGPKPTTVYRKLTKANQKRLDQIGSIFHEHISQIISEGEIGVYVDIYKVNVLYDMSSMNVFWDATDNDEKDEAIQTKLEEKASYLRQTLQSYNVFGYVPVINFMKHLATIKEKQLDEIFNRLNLDPTRLPEEYETDRKTDNDEETVVDGKFCQNTYGLQHDMIMQKVIDAKGGKSAGPQTVTFDNDDDLMSKFARQEYLQKVSKHLQNKNRDKQRQRKISKFIAEQELASELQQGQNDEDYEDIDDYSESDVIYGDEDCEKKDL